MLTNCWLGLTTVLIASNTCVWYAIGAGVELEKVWLARLSCLSWQDISLKNQCLKRFRRCRNNEALRGNVITLQRKQN